MPIFEYSCRHCAHHFETILLSSREKVNCPKCRSKSVVKLLSRFSAPASSKEAAPTASGGCGCTPQTCGCH
jgi:putative FmdB family regulatory protein